MKRFLATLGMALLCSAVIVPQVDAKRLGGGGSSGMRRDMPSKSPDAPAAQKATPNAAQATPAAGAAAAAPKRSWMGPIAGLAAGLGLAALFSHLGMGAEMGNFLMIALMAVAGFFVIRFLMRRFGPQPAQSAAPAGMQFAGAGTPTPFGGTAPREPAFGSSALPTQAAPAAFTPVAPVGLPAGFDGDAFARTAKLIFIRMQAANDAGDLNDLRAFTTPEMFAVAKLDLQERNGASQQTDVVQLDAAVIDVAQEPTQQIVSVRFQGLIREERDSAAAPFDEVWHLVKPVDGSREWAIAGIAPYA